MFGELWRSKIDQREQIWQENRAKLKLLNS